MDKEILRQLKEAETLFEQTEDKDIKELAREEILRLRTQVDLLSPENQRNAIVEIRAGSGGDEAELFAGELLRMYQRYSEQQGWNVELVDKSNSSIGGVKSATMLVKSPRAYATLRFEGGVHRVQRVPKTEKSGRIHTSAASVVVMPEAEDVDVHINPNDLRIDVYHSGGAGGQSVNTTDSAVRITHIPTNIVVACQDERSQLKNKTKAMAVLRSKLWEAARSVQDQDIGDTRRAMIKSGDRSDKIRTYNFPQSRITDHRINKSWHNIDAIMDGAIGPMIEALQEANIALVDA
ncbi:peptide chain release factor 1 [Candidatus Berkelbacteria bacterium RIFCSPLOWO2_01_FULL_50_28]|uniref:Peptide chain release factor 1 n=1 Tax=Candidatus Berkelbacteria bacterium RIFCSPLOWO2_01_FULL_50_28 TaxID=1797471 RepID=A0A1F5EBU4_9BACT|nr:MAG: peptide chain release factor 1 [Candidatus Berkelbacteria bacterium RIFCSPHIGHO2_01_FULL_50_36]OGD64694.1 MAG: peptide chain release factor 1 [Candidatus Berkelbacteria bacterium RIFCSPLOWO2_01_FULL_50_28]